MLFLAACAKTSGTAPGGFSFALLGDAPYGVDQEERFAAMLRQIDDDPSLRFVLHVGDLKGGGEPCTDALLRRRLAQLAIVRTAVVYTPGDNEWTDCHRAAAGRFDPLERLALLRRLAFHRPGETLGRQPMKVQSQADSAAFAEFAENVRFNYGGVVFTTLHVVGSNNDFEPWRGIDPADRTQQPRADRIAEFERRQQANLDWLRQAFDLAESSSAIAVVVLMQANPRFELAPGDPGRAGFEALISELHRQAAQFGRPVLLAHGDRHLYLVDRPLAQATPSAPNLVRVQTYGHPWIRWVRIDVDRAAPDIFRIRSGGGDLEGTQGS